MVTKAAKAPMPPSTSGRRVEAASGPIRRTASSPAPMSTPASRYVSGSMKSKLRFEQSALSDVLRVEADLVLPGKARMAEVARVIAGGLEHPVQREVAERVRGEVALDLRHLVTRPEQLLSGGRVDTVIARPLDGRRRDAHVHLAGPRRAHHLDDLAAGGAADDGIVHSDQPPALPALAGRFELHLDAAMP